MCRCGVPGGVQQRLVMWSIPAILLYVIGFPGYVLYIVLHYKNLIKEDQLLRALGLGGPTPAPSPAEILNPFRSKTKPIIVPTQIQLRNPFLAVMTITEVSFDGKLVGWLCVCVGGWWWW